jgi:VWFA-related protein
MPFSLFVQSGVLAAPLLLCVGMYAQSVPPQPTPTQPIQIQVPPQPQAPPQLNQMVTLHANARAVLLDVVVTDGHGHPVHGLKAENFRITEDGQPQTVASLEEHHAPAATDLANQPKLKDLGPNTFSNRRQPRLDTTATVFLLDALDSSPQAQMYAREQLLSWVGTMQPGTQVAIFQLDTDLRLIQGFSSDPVVLKTALKDRYKPVLSAIPQGRGYVTAVSQMDVLTHAFQSLGTYLQTLPGRKNLVWFTTHAPRYSYDDGSAIGGALHDSQSFLFDYSKATDALRLGEVSVYPIDTRGLQTDPAFSAARGGSFNPRSSQQFATRQFFQHTDLDEVAEATGGKAFYNTNGVKQAVSEVIATGSAYYTVSFYPTNKKWDGSYRQLKVKLDEAPSGTQLEYRRGYYAQANTGPRPEPRAALADSSAPRADGRIQLTHSAPTRDAADFAAAMHLGAVDPGQIIFAARVQPNPTVEKLAKGAPLPENNYLEPKFRDKPFRTFHIFYAIPGDELVLTPEVNGRRHGSVEFVALVVDEKGMLVDSNTATVNMNVKPETYDEMVKKGVEMLVSIAVPEKGSYFLRMGVHDQTSGKAGVIETSTGNITIAPATP